MATIGGLLTFIAVYGFYGMFILSFYFQPNLITFMFCCIGVYMFTNRRTNDKEKD